MNSRLTNDATGGRSGIRYGLILMPLLIFGAVGSFIWFIFLGPKLRHDRLEREGIRMEGTLLNAEETGTVINDHPELDLTVAIRRPTGTVDTAITTFVPGFTEYGLLQRGARVTIAVDSSDPKDFTILAIGDPEPAGSGAAAQVQSANDSLQKMIQRLQDSLRAAQPKTK